MFWRRCFTIPTIKAWGFVEMGVVVVKVAEEVEVIKAVIVSVAIQMVDFKVLSRFADPTAASE